MIALRLAPSSIDCLVSNHREAKPRPALKSRAGQFTPSVFITAHPPCSHLSALHTPILSPELTLSLSHTHTHTHTHSLPFSPLSSSHQDIYAQVAQGESFRGILQSSPLQRLHYSYLSSSIPIRDASMPPGLVAPSARRLTLCSYFPEQGQ